MAFPIVFKMMDKRGTPTQKSEWNSFRGSSLLQAMCKQRWQIETMFKGLKSNGFNIEDSHVRIQERMANLSPLS